MKAVVELVTPQMAKEMLIGSEGFQRNKSIAMINHFAKQMKSGEWQLNGETIVLSEHGQVLDGQHRLCAVIEANVPVKMMVVYGVKQDCFLSFDTGKSRTPGNVLHIAGIKNAVNASSYITFRWKYHKAASRNGSLNMWERPSVSEISSYAKENEALLNGAVWAAQKVRKAVRGINPSTIGGSYLVLSELHSDDACRYFFDKLSTGEGLLKDNPILTLRNKLISCDVGSSSLKWQVKAAYVFQAYKKYAEGKSLTLLRWTEGSDTFPFFR